MIRWKRIPGFPTYLVSSDGRVRTVGGKTLKNVRTSDNYYVVSLNGINYKVHRLVLLAFVGPCPEGYQGCHNDGNKANNHLDNLRWGTPKSNSEDRVRHGTQTRGEDLHFSKLTEEQVIQIRKRYAAGGIRQKDLAKEYGVSDPLIYLIVHDKVWTHLPSYSKGRKYSNRRGNGVYNL